MNENSSLSQVDQSTDQSIEAHMIIINVSKNLRQLDPGDLIHALSDLETLVNLATILKNQVRQLNKTHDQDGNPRPGCIVVKYVNDCGPYGYLVTSSGGKRDWKYLGKAEDGTPVRVYPPGTPLRFFKRRSGWVHVGDWDTQLTNTTPDERLVSEIEENKEVLPSE